MLFKTVDIAVSYIPSHSFHRVAIDISRVLNAEIINIFDPFIYGNTLIHVSSLIPWQAPLVYPRFSRVIWYVALEYVPYKFCISDWIELVTISETCVKWIKQGMDTDARVVYHGIDTDPPTNKELAYKLRKVFGDFVLYIGSNIYRKGVGYLVEAMKILRNEGVKLNLVLVIHTPKENTEFWRPWKIPRYEWIHVFDVDYLRDEDMHAFYEACTVYVQPSFTEGFGLPPLEASIHGKPIVLAPYDVARELFREYKRIVPVKETMFEPFQYGIFIYRLYDPKHMAEMIWDAYNNPDDNLRNYIAQNFSLSTYRQLIEQ